MKTISRYIMTLALLLTAVTGAWAQSYEAKVFDVPASWTEDETHLSAADLPKDFVQITKDEAKALAVPDGDVVLVYGFVGENVLVMAFDNGTAIPNDDDDGAPVSRGNFIMFQTMAKVCYTTPAGPKVAWNASTKTGTFSMPGSDVVLTPIYSAATISHAAGTPEASETPFETLKEAFAAVQDGDVIKLDWNVTLTETLKTPSTASDISFTLDFNGFVIDNTGGTNYIVIDNGCELTLTDNSTAQTGGLKSQYPIAGSNGGKVIFQGGRYSFSGCSSLEIALEWDGLVSTYGWVMGDGKEFVDLNNGQPDDDGFMVRVDWKTFELTIGPKKFATFYADMNIEFAEKPAEGVGLYTISSIDANRSTATVTPISGIIPAGTPMLVYNGTEQKQTAKLIVTLDNAQDAVAWAAQFKGTADEKEFTAADMAAADYYALSGGKAFAPVKGAGTLGANQCWLQFDKQEIPSARQFTLVFDSEATGVSEKGIVNSEKFATATWYDLNGRKVAAPSKKGIYIMNGKKVVIK